MTEIKPCTQCGFSTTPHDSNDAWVCVDCQEYNYYHQPIMEVLVPKLLFKGVIEQRDGEREYSYTEYVVAPSLEEAQAYFENYISTWFGEDGETLIQDDGEVWDSSWEVAAKLDHVGEVQDLQVPGYDGQTHMVKYELLCCS